MNKRIISLLLTAVMLFTLLPVAAFASGPEIIESGSCGKNVTWTIDSEGLLTVSGTGAMSNYSEDEGPWRKNSYQNSLIKALVVEDGVTSIGKYAFKGLDAMKSAKIAGSVKKIGDYAFEFCMHLSDLILQPGITTVGENAFYFCSGLKTLELPDTLTTIGKSAFSYCSGIVNLQLPDSLKTIDDSAFFNCSNMQTVTFGSNLESIGNNAFDSNSQYNLQSIYCTGSKEQFKSVSVNKKTNPYLFSATWSYDHTHEYSFAGTVEPTCTEGGYDKYVCVHGDIKKENLVPAKYHSYETVPGYPPTYDSEGLSDGRRCTVCGHIGLKQEPIPKRIDQISDFLVQGFEAPTPGSKLDYDFEISVRDCAGRIISEGEEKPYAEWYIYDILDEQWLLIDDPDFIVLPMCYYRVKLYLTADEHSQFYCTGTKKNVYSNELYVCKDYMAKKAYALDPGTCKKLCVEAEFTLRYKKIVKDFTLSNVTTTILEGDKVADFAPPVSGNDPTTCDMIWWLMKYDINGNYLGIYVPPSVEDYIIDNMPELGDGLGALTSDAIKQCRKEFGSTFDSKSTYILYISQILKPGYAYSYDYITLKMTAVDGSRNVGEVEVDDVQTEVTVYVVLENMSITKPDKPVITLTKSDGRVKLSWGMVPGADKYQVYRSTDGKSYKRISTTEKTAYTDSSCSSGTKYWYKVRAVNIAGGKTYYSGYSSVKTATPLATPKLKLSVGDGSMKLSWAKIPGADKYYVYRSTDGVSFTRFSTQTGTSCTDTGRVYGKTYYYKVKAVKTVASSNYLSDYSVMVSGTSMAKPTVTLAKTDSGIKLTWKAIDGAAKYQVARSTDNKTFKILKTVTGTSLVNTSVTQGTKYYYKVRPVDAKGNTGAYSAVKSYTILGTPTVTAKQSGTSAALSWTKIAGAEKYSIYRSTDGVSFSLLTTVKTTSFTDKSLTKGSTYYYKVKAATSSNSGSLSDVVSLKIMKTPAITLKSSDGAVKLTWKAIDGAVKYQVYRSTDNKSFKLLSTVKGTSLVNSKVTGGTKYYYKLRAVDKNGGVSAFSSVKSASVLTAPSLSAKLNGTDVTLSWAKCTGAEKYNIYRAANGGEYELITSTAKLSYTDKGLKKSSEYSYRIQAVSGSSLSKFSSVKSVFVMKAPPLELVNDRGGVKVKWDSVSCSNGSYAVKYELLRSTDGKNYSAVFSGKKISYIDTNVTGNTKYYYKVRAYDSAGGVSVASPVRSIVYLATPDVRSQCDKDGKAYVEWEPVKGATEYRVYAYADPDGMYSPYSDTDRHELLEDMEYKTVKECKYYSNPLATYHVVVAIKHSGDKTYESGVSKSVMSW